MRHLFGVSIGPLTVVLVVVACVALGAVSVLAIRNPIFVKLGLRNVARRRGRSAIIVTGLMLGTAIVATALGTGDTMSSTIRSSVLRSLGSTDEIVSPATAETDTATLVDAETRTRYLTAREAATVIDAASDLADVDGVMATITETVAVRDEASRQTEPRVMLFAATEVLPAFGRIENADGREVALSDLGLGEVYLNEKAADQLEATIGDALTVMATGRAAKLVVADIVTYDGTGTGSYALLAPLPAAQSVLRKAGFVTEVRISNVGGATDGVDRTDSVRASLAPTLEPLGLDAHPVKRDGLEHADEEGATFLSMFTTFGTFTIAAGVLLVFLIFVMLAAERRSEMGTARAVGTQRGHLIEMFLFEGMAYDLIAALIGALLGLGIAYVMVEVLAGALESSGLEIQQSFRPRSLVLAYTIGILLTFIVVTLSAWRVSRLNVVAAIRNLAGPPRPSRRRARWLLGVAGLAFGALLAISGRSSAEATPFIMGVGLMLVSLVPVARALGLSERLAFSIGGGALTIWCLLPFRLYEWMVPGLKMDFSVWIGTGLLVVIGATWVLVSNAATVLQATMSLFGRMRTLAPVLKTSIAQPLRNRFRSGTTIALFTLVVFTLVVGVTTSNAFMAASNDEHTFGGGFDVRAETAPLSPISDMPQALESAGVDRSDEFGYASQSFVAVDVRQGRTGDFEGYALRGLNDAFMETTTYEFSAVARGYASSAEVWNALERDPHLAVVDAFAAPRRAKFGFGVQPAFQLRGFYIEDKEFDPVPIEVYDPQSRQTLEFTVIGVFKDTVPLFMTGITVSQQALQDLGDHARSAVWFFTLPNDVNATSVARDLEARLVRNGLEADALDDLLQDMVRTGLTFQWIILGFLALGLVIGVAALGVISARAVVERRQQIGVLRAIGFQRSMVQLSFLLESLFVTTVGIVAGTVLGLLTAYNVITDSARQPSWDNLSFTPPWIALLAILVVVLAASLATTWLPARRASGVHPASALRYQ